MLSYLLIIIGSIITAGMNVLIPNKIAPVVSGIATVIYHQLVVLCR